MMIMKKTQIYSICCSILSLLVSWSNGAFLCSSQYTMKPTGGASPQSIDDNPPPYKFTILNANNEPVKYYKDEVYTIKLSSEDTFFRGFLIQARLSTRQGFIIGHLRSGEFIPEDDWAKSGVQIQNCPAVFNDSLTNRDEEKRSAVEAKWKPNGNDGPIQFVITVTQEPDLYWQQWAPESGLLLPDKNAKFIERKLILKTLVPTDKGNKGLTKFISSGKVESVDENSSDDHRTKKPKNTKPKTTASIKTAEESGEASSNSQEVEESAVTASASSTAKSAVTTSPVVATTVVTVASAVSGTSVRGRRKTTKTTTAQPTTTSTDNEETPTEEEKEEPKIVPIAPPFAGAVVGNSDPKVKTPRIDPANNELDYCASAPCVNNGTCQNLREADRYQCICNSPWGGLDCSELNYCGHNSCSKNAICINGESNYTCKCNVNWTGEFCDKECPVNMCKNSGSCSLDANNKFTCTCKPGYSGDNCGTNIDECLSNPCQNNGTCVDGEDSFTCQCLPGFMGEHCHRPCQDVYQSCSFWQEQDRCESMRPSTRFFDVNCASTCDQCVYKNNTVRTRTPLAPILEPFEFLLGKWAINYSDPTRYPLDFVKSKSGYYEEIDFIVSPVTMFGTPSLNYTARAVNNDDPRDILTSVGFLTLSNVFKPIKVSLMSTGNDGITMLEEGELADNTLKIQTEYFVVNPLLNNITWTLAKREFSLTGSYLRETVSRATAENPSASFSKYFTKKLSSVSY